MADAVLGAIASGAGLASLTIQIFESIQKLNQLYTSIRDAPKEIKGLLNELDLLADILRDYTTAANFPLQPLSAPSSTQRRAASHCARVLKILHDITKEFDAKIKVSACNKIVQWASIRVALRRKQVAELRSHIDSAKLTLILAAQSHLSALISQGLIHPGTFQRVSVKENDDAKTIVCGTENPERISSGITKRSCRASRRMRRIKTYNIGVGTVSLITTQSQPDDKQNASESEWRISLTPWLLSIAISIITQRSLGKVKRTLETCCLVPSDAEIFSVCAIGDNAAIRRLIADGKASPLDMTFEGVTPLAVAARYMHPETCSILLANGADANATFLYRDSIGESHELTPLASAASWFELPVYLNRASEDFREHLDIFPTAMRDTMRMLVEVGQCEIEAGWASTQNTASKSFYRFVFSVPHHCQETPEDFLWLTEPDRINLLGSELDQYYDSIAFAQCMNPVTDIGNTLAAFSRIADMEKFVKLSDEFGRTALHYLLLRLSYVSKNLDSTQVFDALMNLLRAGANLHARDHKGSTPLMFAAWASIDVSVHEFGCWQPEAAASQLAEAFSEWFEFLKEVEKDLRQYVAQEQDLGAEGLLHCGLYRDLLRDYPEESLDRDWFVKLTFIRLDDMEDDGKDEDDYRIDIEYFSVERKFSAPGAWPEEEESQSSDASSNDFECMPGEDAAAYVSPPVITGPETGTGADFSSHQAKENQLSIEGVLVQ